MKKRHLITLLFAVLTACGIFSTSSQALEIAFHQRAEVATDYITLGDIVSFDETNRLTSSLATKVVAKSPRAGENLALNSLQIKKLVLRKTQLSRYTLWTGSPTVTVFRQGQQVLPNQMLDAINDYLEAKQHDLPRAEINFQPRSLPIPFMLPQGKLAIEVVPSNPTILKSSRFSLIFRVDGKVRKNISIQGDLQALAPVVTATSSLRRGTILSPANTREMLKDLTEYENPCTDMRLVLGKRLKRSVRAHNVIEASDVEIPPMVKRGQLVKIIVNHGNLHLTATGIARADGKLNQVIRVRNANSDKLIRGKVTAPGIVEVII